MNFIDKVVIVTGAGSGMGKAIALHFAKLSANLTVADINAETLKNVAEKCGQLNGTNVLSVVVNLRHAEEVKKVVEETMKTYSKIDTVINCAGICRFGSILDPNIIDVYEEIMAVNFKSVVLMTHCVAQELIKSKGCIVNISSTFSVLPTANAVIYNSSKAAINHFTKCVALELAPHGVRANCILPSGVSTNILVHAGMSKEASDIFWKNLEDSSLTKKNVSVEEIAALAAFLASDNARSITGALYNIDAGTMLTGVTLPNSN